MTARHRPPPLPSRGLRVTTAFAPIWAGQDHAGSDWPRRYRQSADAAQIIVVRITKFNLQRAQLGRETRPASAMSFDCEDRGFVEPSGTRSTAISACVAEILTTAATSIRRFEPWSSCSPALHSRVWAIDLISHSTSYPLVTNRYQFQIAVPNIRHVTGTSSMCMMTSTGEMFLSFL